MSDAKTPRPLAITLVLIAMADQLTKAEDAERRWWVLPGRRREARIRLQAMRDMRTAVLAALGIEL